MSIQKEIQLFLDSFIFLVTEEDYQKLWDWYDKNVIPALKENLHLCEVLDNSPRPHAFMCVETDLTKCHRHRIAKTLGESTNYLGDISLEEDKISPDKNDIEFG